MFNIVFSFFVAIMVPYWSASTIAFEKKDYRWIKKSIKKCFIICSAFIIIILTIPFFFEPLVNIWLGKTIHFQTGLVWIMSFFYVLYCILHVECQFINGTGKINVQLIAYCIIGVLNIPLSIFMGYVMGLESVGVRGATSLLLFALIIVLGKNLDGIIKDMEKSEKVLK